MATAGQSYTVTLKQTHLQWGTHRYTSSRNKIYGEGYIPIPSHIAEQFSAQGDLKALGSWFASVHANINDTVRVTWTSPYDVVIETV